LTARRIAVVIAEDLLAVKIEASEGQSIAARIADARDVVPDVGHDQVERDVLLRVHVEVDDDAADPRAAVDHVPRTRGLFHCDADSRRMLSLQLLCDASQHHREAGRGNRAVERHHRGAYDDFCH